MPLFYPLYISNMEEIQLSVYADDTVILHGNTQEKMESTIMDDNTYFYNCDQYFLLVVVILILNSYIFKLHS